MWDASKWLALSSLLSLWIEKRQPILVLVTVASEPSFPLTLGSEDNSGWLVSELDGILGHTFDVKNPISEQGTYEISTANIFQMAKFSKYFFLSQGQNTTH